MNAERIKSALAIVHASERSASNRGGTTRLQATMYALRLVALEAKERAVLANALALTEREKEVIGGIV